MNLGSSAFLLASIVSLASPTDLRAGVTTYLDKTSFLATTGATSASGPLPDIGITSAVAIGTITFDLAPGGDNIAIGASGTLAAPDWCALLPGNDIALGYENLEVTFASPVFSFGCDFVQPDVTMPSFGGTPIDSTYEITLFAGSTQVGQVQFQSIPTDVLGFLGIWSTISFDRATMVDITPSQFVDDDEFFGEFFSGTNPPSSVTACTDKATFLALPGAHSASGPLPNLGVISSAKLGSVTVSIGPSGNSLAIGAFGTQAAPDWYAPLPGNDLAMGYESLELEFDEPVLACGFDFAQPDLTMPSFGGTPIDSTYEIDLYLGTTFVGSVTFTAIPTDTVTFLGACSTSPFDRAIVNDISSSLFADDDEFVGEIFAAPGPAAWTNLAHSLAGTFGDPLLSGFGPLTTGSNGSLALTRAAPSKPAVFIASTTVAPQNALCGTIVPWPPLLVLNLATDGTGEIIAAWPAWSASLAGTTLVFQYLIQDPGAPCGVAMSNALRAQSP